MIRQLRVASLLAFTSITRGNLGVVLLILFILILVSLNLMFVPGLLDGLVNSANDKLITTLSGDIQVESSGSSSLFGDVDQLIQQIKNLKGVEHATPRSSLGAELSHGNRRTTAIVYGVRPETEDTVFSTLDYYIEGNELQPGDTDSIVLGVQLAGAGITDIELYTRSLENVHAGDTIAVTYANGLLKSYTVKGIFRTSFIQTDLQAYVTQQEMETVSPLFVGNATAIHVKTAKGADLKALTAQISSLRGDIRVMTWEDQAGIVHSMTESFNVINAILNIVNLLVAGVTVFIVTYIDVANRKRQIGIQRAIGITPFSITLSYVGRALAYAVVALTLAILIFTYGIIPLEAHFPFRFPFGYVYLRVVPAFMIRTGILLIAVAIAAALVPVQTVMRIKIIDAIWG